MRALILSAGLCLASFAQAEDAAVPAAVTAEDYAMVITYGLVKRNDPSLSNACAALPEVKATTTQLIEDDLALHARGVKDGSWIGEKAFFTDDDRAAARQLLGFVTEANEDEIKKSNPLLVRAMEQTKALNERMEALKGSEAAKA